MSLPRSLASLPHPPALSATRRPSMVRLIPRDEKFYDLFIKDGENLL